MRLRLTPLAAGLLAGLSLLPPSLNAAPANGAGAQRSIALEHLGRYSTGLYDEGGAEIPAYDAKTQRVFVVNLHDRTVDVLDLGNPATPTKIGAIDVSVLGKAANSVSVRSGVLAVAIEANTKTDPGLVAFYDTASLALISTIDVGALPDMLTFSPNGRLVLVANEGEPNSDYSVDPQGSVSIINVTNIKRPSVRHASFTNFNGAAARTQLLADGVRIFGPGASVAQDLEPEYVAISHDSRTAYVTLQENNAMAVVDLTTGVVSTIRAFGAKDHSLPGNGLDASDKDNAVNIAAWPLSGLYMPDAVHLYRSNGHSYLVTANEGDAREYTPLIEEARIKTLSLDPTAFPNAAALKADAALGRLNVSKVSGDTDGDGDYDRLFAFGARSFSIWSESGDLVYDSGDEIEQHVAAQLPSVFNASSTNNSKDDRSDNKGPEPEGLAIGKIDGKTYLFLGLERIGGVMVYDISNPVAPRFVQYINPRDFTVDPKNQLAQAGDLAPEGLVFVDAESSPSGEPLLIVANEVSGTTSVYRIVPTSE